jgi:hypothetical protein
MKQTLRRILSIICAVTFTLSVLIIPVLAASGGGDSPLGILSIENDKATPNHQALTMTVDGVPSGNSPQAFCVGWTFTFKSTAHPDWPSISIYAPLSDIQFTGGTRTYTFPLTNLWTREFTGIAGGKSIRDLTDYKWTYDNIIKDGCTVDADARIRKYSYSNGKYTSLGTEAISPGEIDSKFGEFSSNFKTNTKHDYYPDPLPLTPEPVPTITLTSPPDETTIYLGETITITGDSTYCNSVDIMINDTVYKSFNCTQYKYHVNTNYTPFFVCYSISIKNGFTHRDKSIYPNNIILELK